MHWEEKSPAVLFLHREKKIMRQSKAGKLTAYFFKRQKAPYTTPCWRDCLIFCRQRKGKHTKAPFKYVFCVCFVERCFLQAYGACWWRVAVGEFMKQDLLHEEAVLHSKLGTFSVMVMHFFVFFNALFRLFAFSRFFWEGREEGKKCLSREYLRSTAVHTRQSTTLSRYLFYKMRSCAIMYLFAWSFPSTVLTDSHFWTVFSSLSSGKKLFWNVSPLKRKKKKNIIWKGPLFPALTHTTWQETQKNCQACFFLLRKNISGRINTWHSRWPVNA